MRQRRQGFTLIELAIAIFILLLIMVMGIPSMSGLLSDRRLRRSLDEMNQLVREAQERSVKERRAYLIAWEKEEIVLKPEFLAKGESDEPAMRLRLHRGDAFQLDLPAALVAKPAAEWIFWPNGTCESARIIFKGVNGNWTANYSPLTGRADLVAYVAK